MKIYRVINPENFTHKCEECKEARSALYMIKIDGLFLVLCEKCCKVLEGLLGYRGIVCDGYEVPSFKGGMINICGDYKEPCMTCQKRGNEQEEALEKRAKVFEVTLEDKLNK